MRRLFLIGCVLLFALTACATTEDETTVLELERDISAEILGGTVTIDYPDGWLAQGTDDTITFANREELLTPGFSARRGGDAAGGVTLVTPDALEIYAVSADASITAIARAVAAVTFGDDDTITLRDPASFFVGEREGAVVSGSANTSEEIVGEVAVAVIEVETGYATIVVGSFDGDFVPGELVEAIAASLQYEA